MSIVREHVLKLVKIKYLKGFYSTGIAKRLRVPLAEVEKELDEMVKEGILQKKYELLCHNEHCLRDLDIKDHKNEFKSEYSCGYCGEEIEEVDEDFIREFYTKR